MRCVPPGTNDRRRPKALLAAANQRSLKRLPPHVAVVSLPASAALRRRARRFPMHRFRIWA